MTIRIKRWHLQSNPEIFEVFCSSGCVACSDVFPSKNKEKSCGWGLGVSLTKSFHLDQCSWILNHKEGKAANNTQLKSNKGKPLFQSQELKCLLADIMQSNGRGTLQENTSLTVRGCCFAERGLCSEQWKISTQDIACLWENGFNDSVWFVWCSWSFVNLWV